MSDIEDRELREALGAESRATFGDLRRRLDADRPGGCDAVEAGVTALATGAHETEAKNHIETCARCRDKADAARDVWRRLDWPTSKATFAGLRPRLLAPLPFRAGRAVAAALLVTAVAGLLAWPGPDPSPGGEALAARMEREGLTLEDIANRGTEGAARTLISIGGTRAETLLVGMMGRDPEIDAVISNALAGRSVGPMHPADLVRDARPDLMPALIDAAPPGSASTIVRAIFDPRLRSRAIRALERMPRDEVDSALEWAGYGATLQESEAFAVRGIGVVGALAAASRGGLYRSRCFWRAVTTEGGVEFLLAAAGTPHLRADAFTFLDLLPDEQVAAACRSALGTRELAGGAARVAARLGDRRLVPALVRAARHPPPGMGSAGFEVTEGPLVSGESYAFEAICQQAVSQLTSENGSLEPH